MSIIHITGSGYTEQNDQDNWAAEYLARKLNLHKELDILDHPDGSVTKQKLSSTLQRDIDNTADTADTALDLAGDNESAIKELKSRLTSDEQSTADEHRRIYATIGGLQGLSTADKSDVVSAINEAYSNANNAQTAADNAQQTADNAQAAAYGAQTAVNELEGELDDINTKIKTDSINTSAVVTLSKNTESRYTNAEFSAIEIILPESLSDDFISAVSFVCGTSDFNFVIPDTIKCLGKDCSDWIFIPTEVGYVYDLVFDFNGNSVKCYVG